jgi:hypothetical protein
MLSGKMTLRGEGIPLDCVHTFRNLCLVAEKAGCATPTRTSSYVDNLRRLGLLETDHATPDNEARHLSYREVEMRARAEAKKTFSDLCEYVKASSPPTPAFLANQEQLVKEFLRFTSFGTQFCLACIDAEIGDKRGEPSGETASR